MRRYLFKSDIKDMKRERYEAVIVGSGLAGLYTALLLDEDMSCLVISKSGKDECNTYFAQGGIAAAIDEHDDFTLHFEDTLTAGANLCKRDAVELLVEKGVEEIQNLIKMGVQFDIDYSGELHTTREGGHGRNRILHCNGDATGKEILDHLTKIALQRKNITLKYNSFLADIITDNGSVCGVVAFEDEYTFYQSPHVVICAGGAGQIFKHTTNPPSTTGDGMAAAIRAGAGLGNMEFIQFHPTALYEENPGQSCFLISEAVRGEGGILRNAAGERFMIGRHPMGDLAPRDIVAREIFSEIKKTKTPYVYLDITAKSRDFLETRFPTIFATCLQQGIDISTQQIPVCPVSHYFMGGIRTDLDGRTNIQGLYSCGEAAYTGVHGANRLASNSLLECLVFGRRCAQDINQKRMEEPLHCTPPMPTIEVRRLDKQIFAMFRLRMKEIMTKAGGIVRNADALKMGLIEIGEMIEQLQHAALETPHQMETYNMLLIAETVLRSALSRTESIGSHFREDSLC